MTDPIPNEIKTAYDNDGIPYLLEATGSEAVHITSLLQAEVEGRLLIAPAKEGETIYTISYDCSMCSKCDYYCPDPYGDDPICEHHYPVCPDIDDFGTKICPWHAPHIIPMPFKMSDYAQRQSHKTKFFASLRDAESALDRLMQLRGRSE